LQHFLRCRLELAPVFRSFVAPNFACPAASLVSADFAGAVLAADGGGAGSVDVSRSALELRAGRLDIRS